LAGLIGLVLKVGKFHLSILERPLTCLGRAEKELKR